jgi:hypothetical protein
VSPSLVNYALRREDACGSDGVNTAPLTSALDGRGQLLRLATSPPGKQHSIPITGWASASVWPVCRRGRAVSHASIRNQTARSPGTYASRCTERVSLLCSNITRHETECNFIINSLECSLRVYILCHSASSCRREQDLICSYYAVRIN